MEFAILESVETLRMEVVMKLGNIRYAVLLLLVPLVACVFSHMTFSPTSLTFAPQVISPAGGTSAAQTITVKNTGNKGGAIGPFSTSSSYSETNNCPSSLAAGASCSEQCSAD